MVQALTLVLALLVAIACTGFGSSGSSGKKKKKSEPIHIRPFPQVVDPAEEAAAMESPDVPLPGRR